jgi:predicted PurR-regulated permease PerM
MRSGPGTTHGMTNAELARKTLLVLLLVALALLVWTISGVLVLAFGAALFGVVLSALAGLLCRATRLPRDWALALIVLLLFGLGAGGAWFFGTRLAAEFATLTQTIPASIGRLRAMLQGNDWGQRLLDEFQNLDLAGIGGRAFPTLIGTATSALGAMTDAFLIVVTGLYLAFQPDLYIGGIAQLVPESRRNEVGQFLSAAGHALRLWLLGQLVSMAVVGVLSGLALWFIGVPSPLALGLIAALTEFIPILGPVLGAVPAVLAALAAKPVLALYAAGAFVVIQQIENHLLTPIVQRQTVSLPPALTIFATVVTGVVFGLPGLLVATPLAVVVMVAVKLFYVRDALGEPPRLPGGTSK